MIKYNMSKQVDSSTQSLHTESLSSQGSSSNSTLIINSSQLSEGDSQLDSTLYCIVNEVNKSISRSL
jgi:hypothetical protein